MAQSGFTPISLYYTTTASAAPTAGNLVAGELAINTNDGILYYKDSSGVVQSIASKAVNSGSFANLAYTGTLTGGTGIVNLGSGQFYKDASGNVGIGTTSPSSALQISRPQGAVTITSTTTTNSAYLGFNNGGGTSYVGVDTSTGSVFSSGSYGMTLFNAANSATTFFTNATERCRIDSAGNFLVGTTSPIQSGVLSVLGSASTVGFRTTAAAAGGLVLDLSRTSATGDMVYFRTSSTSLAGYITCPTSNTTSYLSISDYRLKNNVQPMTGALDRVMKLNPCTYNWISDNSKAEGFIADQLQIVVPSAVSGVKDDVNKDGTPKYQAIDTGSAGLIAILTSAIQEQQALIESLTTRLTALETK